jgi:hypothetical protein
MEKEMAPIPTTLQGGATTLSKHPKPPTYKGRNIGIVILTAAQLLIGAIHIFFGALLLAFENLNFLQATIAYDVYTIVFGLLALIFGVLIWQGKKAGWIGTVAVSLFVTVADTLTLLDLPSIPGIPKFAGFTEIGYSLLIIFYLLQKGIRQKYLR